MSTKFNFEKSLKNITSLKSVSIIFRYCAPEYVQVGSKIIRALEIIRVKKLILNIQFYEINICQNLLKNRQTDDIKKRKQEQKEMKQIFLKKKTKTQLKELERKKNR